MTWAWLDPPAIDFGARSPDGERDIRTVWLYADPHRVLGVSDSADATEIRRAYRRLMLVYHPDLNSGKADPLGRFDEIQHAYESIGSEPEVDVQPPAGEWWRVVEVARLPPTRRAGSPVAGVTFEASRPRSGHAAFLEEDVRVLYAGQVIRLALRNSTTRFAAWRSRAGTLAESLALVLACLAIIPVVAVLLGLDVFLVSNGNIYVTWALAVGILALGYGALAAILVGLGRPVPYPRRALRLTRASRK
jgi:hypothetical protein